MRDQLFVDRPWMSRAESPVAELVGMLGTREANLFEDLAAHAWTGQGAIVDAGSFLGKSARAFAGGMRANAAFDASRHRIHCFDDFVCHDEHTVQVIRRGFGDEAPIGGSTRGWFDRQVAPCADLLTVHAGDLMQTDWPDQPIELLMVDVAKSTDLGRRVAALFYRHLIPGLSLVAHQDYHHVWLPHIHVAMEYLADSFELVAPCVDNTAVFAMTAAIPPERLQRVIAHDFSPTEQLELMAAAIERLPVDDRAHVQLAQVRLRQLLGASDDPVAEFEAVVAACPAFGSDLPRDAEDLRRHLLLTFSRECLQRGDTERAFAVADKLEGPYAWYGPALRAAATAGADRRADDEAKDDPLPQRGPDAHAEFVRAELAQSVGQRRIAEGLLLRELLDHGHEIGDSRPHFDLLCSIWEADDRPDHEQHVLARLRRAQPDQPEVDVLAARCSFRRGDLAAATAALRDAVRRGLPERRADDLLAPLGRTWKAFLADDPPVR